ncbi:MAG: DUF5320 domain-containing protein [Deltaproteobacteria bacterium]|nr:DUF5320 domain-containing protein [Candidatus Anaeroferrophillus wilburensis]
MPGFDGSGPRGMGPMTGRGMGYCVQPMGKPMINASLSVAGESRNYGVGRGGLPRGGGRGRAFGGRRGRRAWHHCW